MRYWFPILLSAFVISALTPSVAPAGEDKKNPFAVRDDADDEAPPLTNEEIQRKADEDAKKRDAQAAKDAKNAKTPAANEVPPPPQPKAPPAAAFDAPAAKAAWEAKLGMKFESFVHEYVVVYGQVTSAEMKEIGDALIKAIALIKSTNGPAMLPAQGTPPYEIFFMANDDNVYKFIEKNGGKVDDITRKVRGTTSLKWSCNKPPLPNQHRPHTAVFQFCKFLVVHATNNKTQAWVPEGYASYIECETLGHNENYTISYQENSVKFGKSWYTDCKTLLPQKKLRGWQEMFVLEPIGFSNAHYLTLFSMVGFLNKMDAKTFPKMLQMIHDGQHSSVAVEKAYGKKVKDLELMWANWIMTLK